MSVDTSKLADEIIRDLCEKPVPAMDRFHLHDALTQFECELSAYMEGRGFNLARLAEAIVDRPQTWEGPIADQVVSLSERYGFGDEGEE